MSRLGSRLPHRLAAVAAVAAPGGLAAGAGPPTASPSGPAPAALAPSLAARLARPTGRCPSS